MARMTDEEVMDHLQRNTRLNTIRSKFRAACARIEQAQQQRQPISAIETRRMEFEAVEELLELIHEFGWMDLGESDYS